MSGMKKVMLVPEYIEQFTCIGSDCEDTCCSGWNVTIDQKTYKKYNKIRDPELKKIIDDRVSRNRANQSEIEYGKITMNSDRTCPFLTEHKLCGIQKKLGEEFLSGTCSVYPRVLNQVNNRFEKSGSISCPEIARIALLNPEGITFNEVEGVLSEIDSKMISKKIVTEGTTRRPIIRQNFWNLRIFTIQVLQNRSYPLANRLIMLGSFYHKLQEMVNNNQVDLIESHILKYTDILQDSELMNGFSDIPPLFAVQMQLLKDLIDERVSEGLPQGRYAECFAEFLIGLNYRDDLTVDEIAQNYKFLHDEYYAPFIMDKEYVLENYLVNNVYKNLFPSSEGDVFNEYYFLIVTYAMIKMQLIGMSGYHKEEMNTEHILKLIQSFSKVIEHNRQYLNDIFNLLKHNGYITMPYLAILIKN